MTKTKPTVTIGIPAYNEQANIGHLLEQIIKLDHSAFKLDKIIVYSDGSTDQTAKVVNQLAGKHRRIQLVDNPHRQGVAAGLNHLCQLATSDILVILAADIFIPNPDIINQLIRPIVCQQADLVSPIMEPLLPQTWFEKIIYVGRKYQIKIFNHYQSGNHVYTCYGAARAMSKRLYRQISFPASVGEDMYNYLYCQSLGYQYQLSHSAVVNYKLPDNFTDHRRQSVRYFRSKERMVQEFGPEFVQQQFKFPTRQFLIQGIKQFFQQPFHSSAYALVTLITKSISYFQPQATRQDTWERAVSTTTIH